MDKIKKIFVCDCLFDTAYYLKNNFDDYIFFQITPIPRQYIFFFDDERYIFDDDERYDDRIFIFCKKIIDFFIKNNDDYYDTCMADCAFEFADPNSCNCLDLSCFGFESFCDHCCKMTIDILFKVLYQIENVIIPRNSFSD